MKFDDFLKQKLYNQIDEASYSNDPVLIAFRDAKMKREKELAKPKRKPLYGKQREAAEDDLWNISLELKELYADRGQLLIDMEEEAEIEGGPIADEYGEKLNAIENEIQNLIAKRQKLEIRLAESVETIKDLTEEIELVHVYGKDGKMFGTGELVKTKGNKSLIRWDGSKEEWVDSDLVKLVEKHEGAGKYNTVKKVIAKLGRKPSEEELAEFIINNYYDVTEVEREEDDPSSNKKIADLISFYNFDSADFEIAWFDAQNSQNEEVELAEGRKVTLKRRYTENHPAITVGKYAKIRNKMLEAIGDGKITQQEFDSILKELSNNDKRWMKSNSKYFNVSEEGISLSKLGKRILQSIAVNEAKFTDYTNNELAAYIKNNPKDKEAAKELHKRSQKIKALTRTDEATTKNPEVWVPGEFDKELSKMPNSKITYDVVKKLAKKYGVFLDDAIAYVEYGWNLNLEKYTIENMNEENVMGLSKQETLNVAKKIAQAISKLENGAKATVNMKTLEPGSFDIDLSDEEYDGGSYYITDNGEIKNAAISSHPIYGYVGDSVSQIINTIKKNDSKMFKESKFIYESFNEFVENELVNNESLLEAKNTYNTYEIIEFARKAKEFVIDSEIDILDLAVMYGDKVPASKLERVLSRYDLEIEDLMESNSLLEAFKSSKLSALMDIKGTNWNPKAIKDIMQAVYKATKVKLDQVTDDMLQELTPQAAYKSKAPGLYFYISDNEKLNPYAADSEYKQMIPGNTLLAISNGNNDVYNLEWATRFSKETGKVLVNVGRYKGDDSIGVNKKHSGYGATGLSNVKRLAEVADRVIYFNPDIMPSSEEERKTRAEQKAGATALLDPKKIKAANVARYKEILAQKLLSKADSIDKEVEQVVNAANAYLMAGLTAKKLTQYNELMVGEDPKGRAIKPQDVTNYVRNILDNYARYIQAQNAFEKATDEWDKRYQQKQVKQYTLELRQYLKKWDDKNPNIAW